VIPADRQTAEREILSLMKNGEHIDHFETFRGLMVRPLSAINHAAPYQSLAQSDML